MTNTEDILIERYQYNPLVSLERVAEDYLPEVKWETLKERARKQDLPFPVVIGGSKNRSTYHVSVKSLARWIDRVSEEAAKDHLSMHA